MSITQHGLVVNQARFAKYLPDLAKTLTLWLPARRGAVVLPDIVIKVWKREGEHFYMPRFIDQVVQDPQSRQTKRTPITYAGGVYTIDGRAKFTARSEVPMPTLRDDTGPAPSLLPNQLAIISYCMDNYYTQANLAAGRASMLLDMPAGQGKTYTAAGFVHALGVKNTLYITITRFLITQAINDFAKALPHYTTQQVKYSELALQGGPAADITFMTLSSAAKCDPKYLAMFDFIIMDEIHTYCGDKTSKVFWNVAPYMLGMSGTMNDRPAYDQIYKWHLGNYLDIKTVPGVSIPKTQFKIHVRAISYYGPPEFTKHLTLEKTGDMFYTYMIEQFSHDPYRNTLVCQYVKTMYDAGKYIYVFCVTRNVVNYVAAMLREYLEIDIDTPELAQLMSGVSAEETAAAAAHSRIIVATYDYAGTGVSIQRMTGCVFYDPRKSKMRQIIARILRLGSDESITRDIYDIIDMGTGLKRQSAKRAEIYKEHGARVTRSKVEYDEIEVAECAQRYSDALLELHAGESVPVGEPAESHDEE